MRFKVLEGKHHHSDGKVYTKGQVVRSETELDKIFVNKFTRLEEAESSPKSGASKKDSSKAEAGKAEAKKPATKADADKAARGHEVTNAFPKAAEEGFKVFLRGEQHHVYEGDQTKPINPKGLKGDEVESFVKTYLEE